MEFVGGMAGLLAGASSESGGVFSSSMESSDAELSSQRATEAEEAEEHGMRCLKLARTEQRMPAPVKMAPFFTPNCLFPEGGEQMLSFAPPSKQGALMLTLDGTLPCYHHLSASTPTPSQMRNAGMHTGGSREHEHGALARANGPFTPSQWLEFERQALIYKYIVANIAIPPNLLVSIRSGFGFPPFSAGYFGSRTLGWRQVGKEDPELGRCRRTDGKKWRCSRDVVADQKYCERHMNRGRHRSRKHVESHIDHAAKVIPTTTTPTNSASPAPREGGTSGCLTNSLHQTDCLQTNGCYPSQLDRMEMNSDKVNECSQDFGSFSLPCSLNSSNSGKLFPLSQEQNPFEEESCGFQHRFILMDSPFKPPSSSSDSIQCFNDELSRNQFVSWSAEDMQYDRTQLSISMPKSSSNLEPASPISKERTSFSSHESNGINMVREGVPKEASQYQKGRMLIPSWECSMAGPLGEVLNNARHTADEQCKNLFSSSINFLADGCDLNNWLDSSPTHVLQKTTFRSVSGSARSSPREDDRNSPENKGSLCDDILGSALLHAPTIPS